MFARFARPPPSSLRPALKETYFACFRSADCFSPSKTKAGLVRQESMSRRRKDFCRCHRPTKTLPDTLVNLALAWQKALAAPPAQPGWDRMKAVVPKEVWDGVWGRWSKQAKVLLFNSQASFMRRVHRSMVSLPKRHAHAAHGSSRSPVEVSLTRVSPPEKTFHLLDKLCQRHVVCR